jgi:hypothetical protein
MGIFQVSHGELVGTSRDGRFHDDVESLSQRELVAAVGDAVR